MAGLLLDTSILIWWLAATDRLPREIARRIDTGADAIAVSTVSAWEIEAKRGAGKLECPDDLEEQLREADFNILPLALRHALAAGRLPDHHDDPFDRLLIGQAVCERLTLVSRNAALRAYNVDLLVV
jgi:PIN domain nuclease of toxin-antitoxin system